MAWIPSTSLGVGVQLLETYDDRSDLYWHKAWGKNVGNGLYLCCRMSRPTDTSIVYRLGVNIYFPFLPFPLPRAASRFFASFASISALLAFSWASRSSFSA